MPSIFTLEGARPGVTLFGEPLPLRPRTMVVLGIAGVVLLAGAAYGAVKILGRGMDRQFAK